MNNIKQRIIFPLVLLVIIIGALWLWDSRKHSDNVVSDSSPVATTPQPNQNTPSPTNAQQTTPPKPATPPNQPPAATLLLKVPFTSQAPFANWDQLHNEACEEANALMAGFYFGGNNDATIPADKADAEIHRLVDWEDAHYGYSLDTTSQETANMIEQVYGLKTKLLTDFSADDLKAQLNQNHVVLISTDGRLLNNPNFKSPGPIHHMLLIKGYNSTGIVTNDSGTRNGRNYTYDFKVIHDAAGDWDHSKKAVDLSRKVAIVVWKE